MYQFVEYGWKPAKIDSGTACFKHPEKPLTVLAYNDTPLKNYIPFLTPSDKKWAYAVVDESKEEVIEEDTFSARREAYQTVQDYLKQHRID